MHSLHIQVDIGIGFMVFGKALVGLEWLRGRVWESLGEDAGC
jgi:hypothetical protein